MKTDGKRMFYSDTPNQRENSEAHKGDQNRLETSDGGVAFVCNCSIETNNIKNQNFKRAYFEFREMTLEESPHSFSVISTFLWTEKESKQSSCRRNSEWENRQNASVKHNKPQWQRFVYAFHNHNLPKIHTIWTSCEAHTQADLSKTSIKLSSNCQCLFLNWFEGIISSFNRQLSWF